MSAVALGPGTDDSLWARVCGARYRLRSQVGIYRHRYRGQDWYVLQDPVTLRQFRISEAAYRFLDSLDGKTRVSEAWERLVGESRLLRIERKELLALLAQLHAADLLDSDHPADVDGLLRRRGQQLRQRRRNRWLRPLAIRIPILDPDAFLGRVLPLVRPIFRRGTLWVWVGLMTWALALSAINWTALETYGASRLSDPRNLLLMALVYPLVKGLHEFGHAIAAKRWGGEVHEMGVLILVLMPIPYVDASSASTFAAKGKRIVVAAAGILVETTLAALALMLWLQSPPGLARDIAFDVMVVSGVSTLLFNANPLLRYDGYYVLSDALEIPNLATRAVRYYHYLGRRYLLGLGGAISPATAPGERTWFLVYGAASTLYRVTITLGIALYLATKYLVVGVLLAIWALAVQLVSPLLRLVNFLLFSPGLTGRRGRALIVAASVLLSVITPLYLLPLQQTFLAEGVVQPDEQAMVRAGTEGFVARVFHHSGQVIAAGEALLTLRNEQIQTRIELLRAQLAELKARLSAESLGDRVQAEILRTQIGELHGELAYERFQAEQLTVRSPGEGALYLPRGTDLGGRLVRKGELLGFVLAPRPVTLRVVVPQAAIEELSTELSRAAVLVPGHLEQSLPGTVLSVVPQASDALPSPALGTRGGGAIMVDARDQAGVKTLQRVFEVDISVPYHEGLRFMGSRVYVRFELGSRTLARRGYEALRRLFMDRLKS